MGGEGLMDEIMVVDSHRTMKLVLVGADGTRHELAAPRPADTHGAIVWDLPTHMMVVVSEIELTIHEPA